jgi:poly-gamma-glutamate synthesis protein (capsule biosynthesis protein)
MDIGVLAYCDHQKDFAAGVGRPGISYVDLSLNETVVGILNEVSDLAQECHHVVVAFHWMPNWVSSIPTFYRDLGRKLVHAGASVVWGHSPHHILGVEWVDRSVILFSTGGLVDDYAVDPQFRNDRSLLFRVSLGEEAVESVTGLPIELKFARTEPASEEVWDWTAERLESACLEVGSEAVRRGDWLEIQPQD